MLPAGSDTRAAASATGNIAPAEPAGESEAEVWVRAFADGWRAPASADAFADHFDPLIAPDIRLIQPQLPTVVGREAFREEFARPLFELIPDLHATVTDWAAHGDVLLIEFTLAGTLAGRAVSLACVDRITLRDGVATERRAYFDPTPLLLAIATRPRAWPLFARLQATNLVKRLRGGSR
jgi:ketosteroid isomerase-like protein